MNPRLLFCMLLFLWASAVATTDVNSQTLEGSPSASLEKIRIVDLNGESHDFKDSYDMESRKASIISGGSSNTNQFLKDDLLEAVAAVLRDHPDLILEALEKKPVALAELVHRASIAREIKAEEETRLLELKQPKVPFIDSARPIRGNPEARITIVEYSDFECPFCRSASSTVNEVLGHYDGKVRFVYKHIPLSFHPMAETTARYFEAIALQDPEEAWRFHDRVFEQQDQLVDGEQVLKTIVASLNIDVSTMEVALYGDAVEQRLSHDRDEAERFGFNGTPAFLINGVSLLGSQPKEEFEEIIRMFIPGSQENEHVTASTSP